MLCTEGEKSAEIEGEILERESLRSSIKRHFGLLTDKDSIWSKEQSIGDLMWQIFDSYDQKLIHEMFYNWHKLLLSNEANISDIRKYRSHEKPMQIISMRKKDYYKELGRCNNTLEITNWNIFFC